MIGIILFIVFAVATFFTGKIWWPDLVGFIKGALPIFFFFVAIISLFIGINDIKDAGIRKKELKLEEDKEKKVEEVKKDEEKK